MLGSIFRNVIRLLMSNTAGKFERKPNMKSFMYFIIIVIILGGGYYFYARENRQAMAPTINTNQIQEQKDSELTQPQAETKANTDAEKETENKENVDKAVPVKETQSQFSAEEEQSMADILVVQINYDGKSFSPSALNIKLGDIVIFQNNSSTGFWPASDPHPVHTSYSGFDAKSAIAAGEKWQFVFEKAGTWGFHDHLNPSALGTVTVSTK